MAIWKSSHKIHTQDLKTNSLTSSHLFLFLNEDLHRHRLKYRDLEYNYCFKNTCSKILRMNAKSWLSCLLTIAKGFQPHTARDRLPIPTQSSISKHNRLLWRPRGWKLGLGKQETHGPPALRGSPLGSPVYKEAGRVWGHRLGPSTVSHSSLRPVVQEPRGPS